METPAPPIPDVQTLEARWFVRGPLPPSVAAWFGGPPAEARTDRYLPAPTDDLGVKARADRLETKARLSVEGPFHVGRASGRIEAWRKWGFVLAGGPAAASKTAGWRDVAKRRRQQRCGPDGARRPEGAPAGTTCALELTEIDVDGAPWWSVCLEATGPTAADRRAVLAATAAAWLTRPDAPVLPAGASMGYPEWLRRLDAERESGAAPGGTAPLGARVGSL